jgi:sugar transferase EpsL
MTTMNSTLYNRYGKRLFDLALAVPATILLAPFLALVAILVRITLGRGVLYKQVRPGYLAQPFVLYKFRTMVDIYDDQGNLLPDKERLTWIGIWLRRLSIDELPQLWNVLRGDVSIVGPRPQLIKYVERCSPEQMRRHDVKPGITGWAQVNGRNSITWEERFMLDVWYVDNANFLLDVEILWRTIWVVLSQAGISAHGHATMPEFLGAHGHLAAATAGGSGNFADLEAFDDADEDAAEDWSESEEFVPPRHRELVTIGREVRLDGPANGSYEDELLPSFNSSRSALLAVGNSNHADALLVDGVLHGPAFTRPEVNGHATNGHAINGHGRNGHAINGHDAHAANGESSNGHGVNGHAKHDAAEPLAAEAVVTRKPR